MLVYGSLDVGGMVFAGYDNGFQPTLPFSRCHGVGMFILVLSLGLSDGFQNPEQRWSQGSFLKA